MHRRKVLTFKKSLKTLKHYLGKLNLLSQKSPIHVEMKGAIQATVFLQQALSQIKAWSIECKQIDRKFCKWQNLFGLSSTLH